MIYRTVSLYDMINQKIGKDDIMKILSDFSCPLNNDVEYFIHNKAYDFERVGLARTYLVFVQPNQSCTYLVAVYSLGQSDVQLSDDIKPRHRRKMFGTTYPIGKNIKTLLIRQLAKNYTNGYNNYITGDILMGLVFSRIRDIHMMFPSIVTHIDCKDDEHLRKYYERYGFKLFKKKDDMLIYLLPTNLILEEVMKQENESETEELTAVG